MSKIKGRVSQIIGPVVDVEFSGENNVLPNIHDSLEIKKIIHLREKELSL